MKQAMKSSYEGSIMKHFIQTKDRLKDIPPPTGIK